MALTLQPHPMTTRTWRAAPLLAVAPFIYAVALGLLSEVSLSATLVAFAVTAATLSVGLLARARAFCRQGKHAGPLRRFVREQLLPWEMGLIALTTLIACSQRAPSLGAWPTGAAGPRQPTNVARSVPHETTEDSRAGIAEQDRACNRAHVIRPVWDVVRVFDDEVRVLWSDGDYLVESGETRYSIQPGGALMRTTLTGVPSWVHDIGEEAFDLPIAATVRQIVGHKQGRWFVLEDLEDETVTAWYVAHRDEDTRAAWQRVVLPRGTGPSVVLGQAHGYVLLVAATTLFRTSSGSRRCPGEGDGARL